MHEFKKKSCKFLQSAREKDFQCFYLKELEFVDVHILMQKKAQKDQMQQKEQKKGGQFESIAMMKKRAIYFFAIENVCKLQYWNIFDFPLVKYQMQKSVHTAIVIRFHFLFHI